MAVGDVWGDALLLYPTLSMQVSADVPQDIRRLHQEAVLCLRGRAYAATVLMCRRTLEGLCARSGVNKSTLAQSLEGLRGAGLLDDMMFAWANELRLVGNEAAHDLSRAFSRADAVDVLDFTTAILDYVFSYHVKFENFRMRRAQKSVGS